MGARSEVSMKGNETTGGRERCCGILLCVPVLSANITTPVRRWERLLRVLLRELIKDLKQMKTREYLNLILVWISKTANIES